MTTSHARPTASLGPFIRRHDPDRYFCALFAQAAHRETLFTLYAFNHELARACEVTRQPGLALIRLHWWREVVEGQAKLHEVATPLHAALAGGRLDVPPLLAMIDARDREAEAAFGALADWQDWLHQGAGSLVVAAALAVGAPASLHPRMRRLGAGIGAAGQIRNIDALAAQGRCLLPSALLSEHGLSRDDVIAAPRAPAMVALRTSLAAAAADCLGRPETCPRPFLSAGLAAILARRDLRRQAAGPRGVGDRLAVLRAAAAGFC